MHIRNRHDSSNILPCWFLISGKPTAWLFNSLLIPEDQTKQLRDVVVTYLLYRCKHLCMLKFRVVSPSLTKKVHILHITGYNSACQPGVSYPRMYQNFPKVDLLDGVYRGVPCVCSSRTVKIVLHMSFALAQCVNFSLSSGRMRPAGQCLDHDELGDNPHL